LGNKVFTFLHIEQKASIGLGYVMAPENPLASHQTPQFMDADQNPSRGRAFRGKAQARGHATRRASALRHTRDSGEAHIYLLDNKETA
jgi:hypothetical protein